MGGAITQSRTVRRAGDPRVNSSALVAVAVQGEITCPLGRPSPYRIGRDGVPRILPGTGGIVYLVQGPISEDVDLATADGRLVGTETRGGAGRAIASEDADGDGVTETFTVNCKSFISLGTW